MRKKECNQIPILVIFAFLLHQVKDPTLLLELLNQSSGYSMQLCIDKQGQPTELNMSNS